MGSISDVGIIPPDYARGVGNPEVYHNKVLRVCRKVKNWGTGTTKTFAFKVVYAVTQAEKKNCMTLLGAAANEREANLDPLCGVIAPTLFGGGSVNIPSLSGPTGVLTRTDMVTRSANVEAGKSADITAKDQLPTGARIMSTRYQIAVPASGWVDCESVSGQCPIPTATWVKHSEDSGTLQNSGKALLLGRVILEFIEVNPLDLGKMYGIQRE